MFTEYADAKRLRRTLMSQEEFRPFPGYRDRAAWDALPALFRDATMAKKQRTLDFEVSALYATHYMAWARGLRDDRPEPNTRGALLDALLIELVEGKGAMIDKIIDLVWALCERTTWIDEAHNNHMFGFMETGKFKRQLPEVTDDNFIDLRAAENAALLAWVCYFLGDALDEQSEQIVRRVEYEFRRRIEKPFMTHDDMTWMGFYGHAINNWNPWIVTNCAVATLILERDARVRADMLARFMEKIDLLANFTTEDGASDEGPAYWNESGCTLLDFAALLDYATRGDIDLIRAPKLRNIAEYQMKVHIAGERFFNYGDCPAILGYNAATHYRNARLVGSEALRRFSLSRAPEKSPLTDACLHFEPALMYRSLGNLFSVCGGRYEREAYAPADAWLPDMQIMTARDDSGRVFLGAKGSHNACSHNHNDVGHFALYFGDEPVIVDLGYGVYRQGTFGVHRYENWFMNSEWHNCCLLNGAHQLPGAQYRATDLRCDMDGAHASVRMTLTEVYPREAGVRSHARALTLDKKTGEVLLRDEIDAETCEIQFVLPRRPETGEGWAEMPLRGGGRARIEFDAKRLAPRVDEKAVEDPWLEKNWGKSVYRLSLCASDARALISEARVRFVGR